MPIRLVCCLTILALCACTNPAQKKEAVTQTTIASAPEKATAVAPVAPAAERPEQVVKDLYAARQDRETPFFQTKSRALVDQFFTNKLADLIWNDAKDRAKTGEVGRLGFDPLYAAQDLDLLNLTIKPARVAGKRAEVTVSFLNFNKPHSFTYLLDKEANRWRIGDILYDDGSQLAPLLSGKTE
jgi:Protein of unknown function (DUF3828)